VKGLGADMIVETFVDIPGVLAILSGAA